MGSVYTGFTRVGVWKYLCGKRAVLKEYKGSFYRKGCVILAVKWG